MKNKILALSLAVSMCAAPLGAKETRTHIPFYILNSASQYNIDASLMYAICKVESSCRPTAINRDDGTPAEKAAGLKVRSYGLFQLRGDTAHGLGFEEKEVITIVKKRGKKLVTTHKTVNHIKDLLKPEVNAFYAAKLLRRLYDKYHSTERVISAYNAGQPIQGNKEYVLLVLKNYVRIVIDERMSYGK